MNKTVTKTHPVIVHAINEVLSSPKNTAIKINRVRMDAALSSNRFVIPAGLDREKIRQFILSHV